MEAESLVFLILRKNQKKKYVKEDLSWRKLKKIASTILVFNFDLEDRKLNGCCSSGVGGNKKEKKVTVVQHT